MSDSALTAWWDFANQKTLAARQGLGPTLGCARADATATRINAAGLVEIVPANAGRFDHALDSGKSLGLLIEEGRANSCLHNRDGTNAAWVKSNMTPAKDQIGEDGVINSATSLLATAGNATAIQAITLGSAAHSGSFSIKRLIGTGDVDITIDNGSTWATVSINALGYTRFSVTQTLANPNIGVRLVTSGDKIAIDYQGLEVGAFATSRIATGVAAVTRNPDVISTTEMGWYNAAAGTIYAAVSKPAGYGFNTDYLYTISTGSSLERMIEQVGAGNSGFTVVAGGATVANLVENSQSFDADTTHRMASSFAVNDFEHYWNGVRAGTGDQAGALPAAANRLHLGVNQAGTGRFLNGHLDEWRFYNEDRDIQFLEDLTNDLINEASGGMIPIMRRRRGR